MSSSCRGRVIVVLLAGILIACDGSTEVPNANETAPAKPAIPSDLADRWRSEIIELPSEFAPGLPRGVEELRFAPGMYKEEAEDYWSYVFVLRFEEKIEGRARLKELLDQYYTGLITAVAKSREISLDRPAARIEVTALDDRRYRADVDLVDAFVTGKPLIVTMDVRLKDGKSGTDVLAAVSPQPRTHDIWRSLKAVLAAIE